MKTFIWNPWHGCHKCSTGCLRCYVFENDKNFGINTNKIKITRNGFRLPIQKIRNKDLEKYELQYKIPSGSMVITSMTSDFFIEEADVWRQDAWNFIHERQDCLFSITTKRPQRIKQCLPPNWLDGYYNVIINVSIENTYTAWERIPILFDLPIKHIGIEIEPMLEDIDLKPFLSSGLIKQVTIGGESYTGWNGLSRILKMTWVKNIQQQCKYFETPFKFNSTGSRFELENGNIINIRNKKDEKALAKFYNLDVETDDINWEVTAEELELKSLAEKAYNIYKKLNN